MQTNSISMSKQTIKVLYNNKSQGEASGVFKLLIQKFSSNKNRQRQAPLTQGK